MPPTPDELLAQVRQAAQGHEVFGELGRKGDDDVWFLARAEGETALVALRLRLEPDPAGGEPVRSLEVAKELGSQVAMGEGDCWKCQSKLRSFARFCSRCGADQTQGTRVATSEGERVALLEEVRSAAGDAYDVLGEMLWGGGAGAIYFALEKISGQLVRLRLRQGDDGLELGETEVGMSLSGHLTAAYMTQVGSAPAPKPVIRRVSRPEPAPDAVPAPGRSGAVSVDVGPASAPARPVASPAPAAPAGWTPRERILLASVIVLGVAVLALGALVLSR